MNSCFITKGELWELLKEDSANFAFWLNSGTNESNAVKTMFEFTNTVDLNGDTVNNIVIPLLLANNIISQNTLNRVNEYVSKNSGYVTYE